MNHFQERLFCTSYLVLCALYLRFVAMKVFASKNVRQISGKSSNLMYQQPIP